MSTILTILIRSNRMRFLSRPRSATAAGATGPLRVWFVAMAIGFVAGCPSKAPGLETPAQAEEVTWHEGMHVAGARKARDETWSEWLRRPWRSESDQETSYYVYRLDGSVEPGVADEDTVATCEQLFEADLRGLQPPTQQERAPYGELRLGCYAARAVSRGREPDTSFLSDFRMDESHFRALPPELATMMSPGQQSDRIDEIIDAGGRLGDVLDLTMEGPTYDYGNARQSKKIAVRDSDGWVQDWTWLARGDLDHDGVDDLLITSGLYSPDGVSLVDHRLFVVTKRTASSPIELIQEIPLYPGDEAGLCGERANRCARETVP